MAELLPAVPFCGVAVMAKASEPGLTKTRLCPPLMAAEAAAINTAFLRDIADNLLAAAEKRSITGWIAYGPPGAGGFFREILPPSLTLCEIWFPNFGDCLSRSMDALFAAGHRAGCLLNSDSPTLPISLLTETVDALKQPGDRTVLGPATDGGYYLIACKAPHRRLFQDIMWSSPIVAKQTLERAREIGLEVHLLPEWYDVDDLHSLRMLAGELFGGQRFSQHLQSSPARHCRELFASMGNLPQRLGLTAETAI